MQDGDTRNGSLVAGQSAGLVKESLSCREIISRMVSRLRFNDQEAMAGINVKEIS